MEQMRKNADSCVAVLRYVSNNEATATARCRWRGERTNDEDEKKEQTGSCLLLPFMYKSFDSPQELRRVIVPT